jgi:hypothetical protein
MTISGLTGKDVSILVSDPWEFVTEHGAGPVSAKILQTGPHSRGADTDAMLVRFDKPVTFRNLHCEYFIAAPRLETDSLEALAKGTEMHCNLTRIPEEQAVSHTPFDLSSWRGGIALIGTIRIS